jgi:hypothetical protein
MWRAPAGAPTGGVLRPARNTNAVHPQRARNVLECLLAQILEGEIELARGIPLHESRNTDPAGLRQAFQACCDVHAITQDVAVFGHHIAHIEQFC